MNTAKSFSVKTPLSKDWFKNNHKKVFNGVDYDLEFIKIQQGMIGTVYNKENPSKSEWYVITTQEELNKVLDWFFRFNSKELTNGNYNITK